MDAPLVLQLAALAGAAAGSSFATKAVERWVDARRKRLGGEPPSPLTWQDALAGVNQRMTELVGTLNVRMESNFAELRNAILAHHQVAFPALERAVARLDLAMADHAGREHEEVDARLAKLEARCGRCAFKESRPQAN